MFVTVEGLDGAGTTSLVEALSMHLDCETTEEPTNNWVGSMIRYSLKNDDINPLVDTHLFFADRVHHTETKLKQHVENDDTLLVSDRYVDSTRAYQPPALADTEYFESQTTAKIYIEQCMVPWLHEPDLTLYLQVPVEEAMERNNGEDKFENGEFLQHVKRNYDALAANEGRIHTIDATQSLHDVTREAEQIIYDELL